MEGVGRNEILNWINDLLQLDYKKIEQMGSGAALCQLIDVIHPGKINLKMVNFNAKYDYEYIKNFSYLQESFAKLGVEKYVEVSELVKSRPQANLEFCQWMKKYFDNLYSGEPYNALERRAQLKISTDRDKTLLKGSKISATTTTKPAAGISKPTTATTVSKPTTTVKPTTTTSTIPKPTTSTGLKSKPTPASTISKPTTTSTVSKPKPATTTSTTTTTSVSTPPSTPSHKSTSSTAATSTTSKPTISQPGFKPTPKSLSPTPPPVSVQPTTITTTKTIVVSEAPAELLAELEQQKQQLAAQKLEIEQQKQELEVQRIQIQEMTEKITNQDLASQDVEKDRDFYFERLREAEIFCQQHETNELLGHVLKILYNTDQEEGEEGIEGEESEPEPELNIDQLKIDGSEDHEEIHSEQEEHEEEEIHSQEEIIHSEEEHFEQHEEEEDVDGLNEEEIMNKVLEESDHDDDDDILDSTFNGEDELLETQEELMENLQDEY